MTPGSTVPHALAKSYVALRDVIDADLPIFFAQQLNEEANYMAAFTVDDPHDHAAFDAHWARIWGNPTIVHKTIVYADAVAGYLASFDRWGAREVSYWLGREYWGQGVATEALRLFLELFSTRPLSARAAKDNLASILVLKKCGFVVVGHDKGFANARRAEIEEVIRRLDEEA